MNFPVHYPVFFTATISEWKHLLAENKFKDIFTNSLAFLVKENKVSVYGFVIMSNHIHIIWRVMNDFNPVVIQHSFMKYTAQMMIKDLRNNNPELLQQFFVNAKDRKYQIWERNSLSIEIHSNDVLLQKLNYLHNNPVKAGLCLMPEEYHYSSASLYSDNKIKWDFLERWK
ncbi:MAG: transposase [Chitinophaga sp.]|jgi:putative transposase|nr:transposase [Chitinophaga sp.]